MYAFVAHLKPPLINDENIDPIYQAISRVSLSLQECQ